MKYCRAILWLTTLAVLPVAAIALTQEKELSERQSFSAPRPPEHISKVLDAISKGLVALDKHMLECQSKKYIPLADSIYELCIQPDDGVNEGGWYMTVTFLPRTPSAEMWVTIEKDGAVEIADGL